MSRSMCGVYLIRSTSSGYFYYGSSSDCSKRKRGHMSALRNGRHHSVHMQRVFDKYGEADFRFTFVVRCNSLEAAFIAEAALIAEHIEDPYCMNIANGACGGDNLTFNPKRNKIIAKMTKSLRARMAALTPEQRKAIYGQPQERNGMWGRTHTEAARAAISAANSGNSYRVGYRCTDEAKANMSRAAKLRESQPGYTNGFKGKKHSKKYKQAASERQSERMKNPENMPRNTLRVRVGKKVYRSCSAAAEKIGCSVATIGNRVRSDKFPEYSYVD